MVKKVSSQPDNDVTSDADTGDTLQEQFTANFAESPEMQAIFTKGEVDGNVIYYEVPSGLEWSADSLINIEPYVESDGDTGKDANEDLDKDSDGDDSTIPQTNTVETKPMPVPGYLTKDKAAYVPSAPVRFVEALPKGHLIKIGEPITVVGEIENGYVITSMPVYRESRPLRSIQSTYTLVYPKGKRIPVKNVVVVEPEATE